MTSAASAERRFGRKSSFACVHVEIYPAYRKRGSLKHLAGSEVGAGVFTVDKLPEDSALELRSVEVEADA